MSLYEKLGGKQAIESAVEIFYKKVTADRTLSRFFKGANMASLKRMQAQFLSYAFGRDGGYKGKNLAEAHAHLADSGLTDKHFDSVLKHLGNTLKEMGVADELIEEAATIAESTREIIMGRADVSKASATGSDDSARFMSAIEGSATSIMMVDRDLVVTYMNDASRLMITENLAEFEAAYPGFSVDNLIGSCIDVFHKNPAHQRKILSNPDNLPWRADIKIGKLTFALNVSAMRDSSGEYIGNNLEWSNVTEARRQANEAARSLSSIEGSATAIMMVDRDLVVTYMNEASKTMVSENLEEFEAAYPGFSLDNLIGSCIDVFHKNPAHQRKILSDPDNLPWRADIKIGKLTFALNVSAMRDSKGEYIGNNLEWSNVTQTRIKANEAARSQSSIDGSATAMMMVDRDLVVTYINQATHKMVAENLSEFEATFPGFDLNSLVGTCIDVFHKNPAHQRKLLSDPGNLPWKTDINIGSLVFALNVSAMTDESGNYIGNTLEWSNATQERRLTNEAARIQSAIAGSATAMMMVDRDLVVTYLNDSTTKMISENLSEFEAAFPGFRLDGLIGTCIDVFHKNPAHQRKILSDPSNLPYRADIRVGNLVFGLNVSAMIDGSGNYIGNTLEWSNVTEAREQANRAALTQSSIDGSATAMMMVDRDLVITYFNDASRKLISDNLDEFKSSFPGFTLEGLMGTCIDTFHKNPAHQRKILSDPANLPFKSEMKVGNIYISLNVSAMQDSEGNYIGNTLEWGDITEQKEFSEVTILQLDERTQNLKTANDSMVAMSETVNSQLADMSKETSSAASGAEEMNVTMTEVASAAELATANINSVTVATEQMTNSVAEIANNAEKARDVTQSAVAYVGNASSRVEELNKAAKDISKVIEVIVEIAEQTKLLALNATIEAARAGEAGKGFAVVANEVKELAKQTREATIDIREKIENMQSSTTGTVGEIGNINNVINDVNEIVAIIATSVEEQNVTTKDIASNIAQATSGVQDVTARVVEVTKVSREVADNVNNINAGITEIGESGDSLSTSINLVRETSDGLQEMVTVLREKAKG